jgi:hypothetical protein
VKGGPRVKEASRPHQRMGILVASHRDEPLSNSTLVFFCVFCLINESAHRSNQILTRRRMKWTLWCNVARIDLVQSTLGVVGMD